MQKRIWKIDVSSYGFKYVIFVYGEERRVIDYIHSEITGHVKFYSGATEEEVSAARILGLPVYMV